MLRVNTKFSCNFSKSPGHCNTGYREKLDTETRDLSSYVYRSGNKWTISAFWFDNGTSACKNHGKSKEPPNKKSYICENSKEQNKFKVRLKTDRNELLPDENRFEMQE